MIDAPTYVLVLLLRFVNIHPIPDVPCANSRQFYCNYCNFIAVFYNITSLDERASSVLCNLFQEFRFI